MSDIFDLLTGRKQEIPENDGVFKDTGFVGPTYLVKYFSFYSSEDLELYGEKYKKSSGECIDYNRVGPNNSWFYYFPKKEDAEEASKLLGRKYPPSRVWRFESPTSQILNLRSPDKWGVSIASDCQISSAGYKKLRHEFHLMTMPSLVDAVARSAGYIKEQIWNVDELLCGISDEAFTDELHHRLIGDPAATDRDLEKIEEIYNNNGNDIDLTLDEAVNAGVKIHYKFSLLYHRRAQLWRALGENNSDVYLPVGGALTDFGKDKETTSEKLSQCLRFSTEELDDPIWLRWHMCKNPRVDAVTNAGNRLNLPVVSEVFRNEEEAKNAVGDESSNNDSDNTSNGLPQTPETWGNEAVNEWRETVRDTKVEYGDTLPALPTLVKIAKQLSCSIDDLRNWWDVA